MEKSDFKLMAIADRSHAQKYIKTAITDLLAAHKTSCMAIADRSQVYHDGDYSPPCGTQTHQHGDR